MEGVWDKATRCFRGGGGALGEEACLRCAKLHVKSVLNE